MKQILVVLLLVLCIPVHADDYKIVQMNTNSIKIGNSICKQGDVFSDNDNIIWTNENQAMKAMNLKTKQIRLFVAKQFMKINARSIKHYFIKNVNLSTRGELSSFSELEKMLSDTLYLYDTMPVESPVMIDSLSSYTISYFDGGKKWRNLMSTDDTFYLSRELFEVDDNMKTFNITLYFRTKGKDDYLITDKLNVVILPMQIKE